MFAREAEPMQALYVCPFRGLDAFSGYNESFLHNGRNVAGHGKISTTAFIYCCEIMKVKRLG
jgi:hypothetical protein